MTQCALPGCTNAVHPLHVYTIVMRDEKYCSRACVDKAFASQGKRKKESRMPQVPADDFGGAGVIRRFCDRKVCGARILVRWPGRGKNSNREYCSNECSKLAETENEGETTMKSMTDATATAAAAPSPIVAGAPAKKKTAKTAAKKTAKTAKKTAKTAKKTTDESNKNIKIAVDLVSRKKGATVAEIAAATGWNEDSVRWNISQRLRGKLGLNVVGEKGADGERTYKVA